MTNPAFFERAHDGILQLRAYEPGKPVSDLQRELGLDSIIKLASNENPLGMAPAAAQALADWHGNLGLYPDGNGLALKEKLAARFDIDVNRITLGNGSSEILDLTARIFLGPGRNAVYSQYGFAVYPITTLGMHAEPREVPALGASDNMPCGHDLDAFADYMDDNTGVVFIASPTNPIGTWLAPSAIEAFVENTPEHVVIVLDEAYVEYQDEDKRVDSRALLERHPNLIVTRTFSKIFGMAGLRVGYSLSSPEMADLLNRIRPAFNVNELAQYCACAALDDDAFVTRSYRENAQERERLQRGLQERGLVCLPSQGNFITFDCGQPSTPLFDALLREGVIVRPLASYGMTRHLRVTVGTAADNATFLAALDKVLAAP